MKMKFKVNNGRTIEMFQPEKMARYTQPPTSSKGEKESSEIISPRRLCDDVQLVQVQKQGKASLIFRRTDHGEIS